MWASTLMEPPYSAERYTITLCSEVCSIEWRGEKGALYACEVPQTGCTRL